MFNSSNSFFSRLLLIKNHLAANPKLLKFEDEPLPALNSRLSSSNKKYLKSLLYPRNDEREKILSELSKDSDFLQFKELEDKKQLNKMNLKNEIQIIFYSQIFFFSFCFWLGLSPLC